MAENPISWANFSRVSPPGPQGERTQTEEEARPWWECLCLHAAHVTNHKYLHLSRHSLHSLSGHWAVRHIMCLPPCQAAGSLIAPDEAEWRGEGKEITTSHHARPLSVAGSQDDGYLESSFHQGKYAGNVDNRSLWSPAWAPKRWINWIVWVTPFHYSPTPVVTTDQWLIPDGDRDQSREQILTIDLL